MPATKYDEGFFTASDGVRLYEQGWMPEGNPKGLVVLVHGYGEHSARYDKVARVLTEAGFGVRAYDHRGHGQSGGKRAHVFNFDEYVTDLTAFVARARAKVEAPAFLLGHSMGGLVSVRFLETKPEAAQLKGAVLTGPFLGLAMKVPAVKVAAGKAMSKLAPGFAMPSGIDPAILSHDKDVVDRYANDPLVNKIATARWFTETMAAIQSAFDAAGSVRLPVLICHGGDDRLADIAGARRLYEGAGSADKTFHEFPGLYHEIMFEAERKPVLDLIVGWLEAHARREG